MTKSMIPKFCVAITILFIFDPQTTKAEETTKDTKNTDIIFPDHYSGNKPPFSPEFYRLPSDLYKQSRTSLSKDGEDQRGSPQAWRPLPRTSLSKDGEDQLVRWINAKIRARTSLSKDGEDQQRRYRMPIRPITNLSRISDSYMSRHLLRHAPRNNGWEKVLRNSKGKGKLLAPLFLIAAGVAFFFENPGLGLVVIILGLSGVFIWLCVTQGKSSTVKSGKNTDSASEDHNSLRPSRVSSGSDQDPARTQASIEPTMANNDEGTSAQNSSSVQTGEYFLHEGIAFCTGNDGRDMDYTKAKECFQKASSQGVAEADKWLKDLQNM